MRHNHNILKLVVNILNNQSYYYKLRAMEVVEEEDLERVEGLRDLKERVREKLGGERERERETDRQSPTTEV